MKDKDVKENLMLEIMSGQNFIESIMRTNDDTENFGLRLSEEDAKLLMERRKESLKAQRRVEFGEGILPKLIYAFADSAFINQENYVETIARLQEIFYEYKNETMDRVPDDELIEFMKEKFDGECAGSTEFLEETVLYEFARKN